MTTLQHWLTPGNTDATIKHLESVFRRVAGTWLAYDYNECGRWLDALTDRHTGGRAPAETRYLLASGLTEDLEHTLEMLGADASDRSSVLLNLLNEYRIANVEKALTSKPDRPRFSETGVYDEGESMHDGRSLLRRVYDLEHGTILFSALPQGHSQYSGWLDNRNTLD
jgi:hypothetical protein